jgi:hypothetical protein
MDHVEYFKQNKYVYVPELMNKDVTNFIYNYLVLKACTNQEFGGEGESDKYVRYCYGDLATETLSGILLDSISNITQKKLCPTYSYTRVYLKGEILKPHFDRAACQYSVTVNFGGDPWPIYFGEFNKDKDMDNGYSLKNEITLKPGDGIIYMGEELIHWRNAFKGEHCVQAFLHYIDMEGPHYPEHAYDKRVNIGYTK